MCITKVEKIWYRGAVLKQAFEEYKTCLKDVYLKADKILSPPSNTPIEFNVGMNKMPQGFLSLRKNIFSTLFQSTYQLLGIKKERRILYGTLNHLFRIWVTSADNLLDGEDKIVVPIRMPGNSRTMRQIVSIMTADRIMKQLLEEAVETGVIYSEDSKILSNMSLQILLPSAAEEASEEGGIVQRPECGYVLYTIHRLKTGFLFHVPFLGPETIEGDIDMGLLNRCKDALDRFGLGCQLLDDISDMARDYLENRHNYVLSKIHCEGKTFYIEQLQKLGKRINASTKIHSYFPEVVYPTLELAVDLLRGGLLILDECGLGVGEHFTEMMAFSMLKILNVGDLVECLKAKQAIKTKESLLRDVRLAM